MAGLSELKHAENADAIHRFRGGDHDFGKAIS